MRTLRVERFDVAVERAQRNPERLGQHRAADRTPIATQKLNEIEQALCARHYPPRLPKPTKVYQDMLPKRVSIIRRNRPLPARGRGQDRARLIWINSLCPIGRVGLHSGRNERGADHQTPCRSGAVDGRLGAGIWSRDASRLYRFGRAIQAGRVWTNCYHACPAHAAFGGYKQSGVGRETHKMMLDHYQQTKNLLVSYSPKKLGFF